MLRIRYKNIIYESNSSSQQTVTIWDGELWGAKSTFFSLDGKNQEDCMVIMHTDKGDMLHFHFPKERDVKGNISVPAKSEDKEKKLDALFKALSKYYKSGQKLSTSGNGSPGGIAGLRGLDNYGFKITGYTDDPEHNHWGDSSFVNQEKLQQWISKNSDKPYVGFTKDGKSYPKYPILTKI